MAIWAQSLMKWIEKSESDLKLLHFIPNLNNQQFVIDAINRYDKLHNTLEDYITKNRFEGWKKEISDFVKEEDSKQMDSKL